VINHDDLIVERRPELGILPAVHADIGPHAIALTDRGPPITKSRTIHRHPAADDRDQPTTGLEPQKRLLNVSRSKGGSMSIHSTAGRGKRRVHHNGVVALLGRQKIVQTLGIHRRRLESLKGQQISPARIDFIGFNLGAGQSCEDRDVSRARARFKHIHARTKRRRLHDDQCLGGRRTELLEFDLLLIARRLRGQSLLFSKKPVNCGWRIAEVEADLIQVDVETRFGRIVGIAAVAGCGSEDVMGQSSYCRVIKRGSGIGLEERGEPDCKT
jgi:hypothetical protein